MEKFKFIDLEYLKKHSQGNRKIEKQMLTIYLTEIPSILKKLKVGLEEKDPVKVGKAAYRAKNILPTIGLNSSANDLIEIDNLCRNLENVGRVGQLIATFETTAHSSLQEIREALLEYKDVSE